jgi:hypothetical protein
LSKEQKESRIKIEELPTTEKELTKEEAEQVSGGGSLSPVHLDLLGVIDPQGRRRQEQNKIAVDPSDPSGNTIY